jgi:hypothetical protein
VEGQQSGCQRIAMNAIVEVRLDLLAPNPLLIVVRDPPHERPLGVHAHANVGIGKEAQGFLTRQVAMVKVPEVAPVVDEAVLGDPVRAPS